MKTISIKKVPGQTAGVHQKHYPAFRASFIRWLISERTGASQQSDNSPVIPHQALPAAECMRQARMIFEYNGIIIL
jgi:hypothetical protein